MYDSSDGLGRGHEQSAPGLGANERARVTGAGDRLIEGSPRLRSGQALRLRFARELDPTDRPDAALIFGGDGTIHRHLGGLALKPIGVYLPESGRDRRAAECPAGDCWSMKAGEIP